MYVDAILPKQSRHALGWHLLITTNQTPSSLICIFMRAWKALVPLLRVGSMKSLCINESLYIYIYIEWWSQKFLFGGSSCSTNIFIKITLHTHIYTYTLFYYIYTHIYTHIFYFISYIYIYIYIYTHTHPTTTKKLSIFNQNYIWWRYFIK